MPPSRSKTLRDKDNKDREKNLRPPGNVVVIGGSQGAVEALLEIIPSLPAELPAAVFVVVHLPSEYRSSLPAVLGRGASLKCSHPMDRERIRAGNVYVA